MSEVARRAPTLSALLALAWPIVVSRSAQVVVGFTDAAMVADLGDAAMAATTAGSLNSFALLILPFGIVSAVASFASQLAGRGDFEGARRYGWYGLIVAAVGQIACLASLPFMGHAVGLMSHPAEVGGPMRDYLVLRLSTGGAAIGLEALGNYYAGVNRTRIPMLAQILAMVLNVALCWVLIYGHLGAPAMGVRGSALASALATLIAFLALFACFWFRVGAPERDERVPRRASPLRLIELRRVLKFGLPSGLNWFLEFAAFVVFVDLVVADLGTVPLAAMMAVMQLNSIAFMPAFGIASAGAVFVGQAIGAGRKDDVPATVGLTMRVTAAWQGLVALMYLAVPFVLLHPFQPPSDAAVFVATGAVVLRLSAAWQLFDAAANTLAEALRAAGDTTFSSIARAVIAWGIFTPGVFVSVRSLRGGIVAATLWLVAYLALLAGVLWLRFRSDRWREIRLVDHASEELLPEEAPAPAEG